MSTLFQALRILVKPRQPWPDYHDLSLLHLSIFIILPATAFSIMSAVLLKSESGTITIVSAFSTPVANILFSAIAFKWLCPLFKGKVQWKNSILLAMFINLPFILILAVSYHLNSEFIWLSLLFCFYLLWWGTGYWLEIAGHLRIQFMLISLIFMAIFWIILILFIQFLIIYLLEISIFQVKLTENQQFK